MDGTGPSQKTHNICITFIQRGLNIFDVGPTLYKCYTTVLHLLEWTNYTNVTNMGPYINVLDCGCDNNDNENILSTGSQRVMGMCHSFE